MSQVAEPIARVSIFKNIKQSTGGEVFELSQIYEAIKTDYWLPKIEVYRQFPQTTKDEEKIAKEYKDTLPYFTGCGVFPERRKAGYPVEPNGRLVIDVDSVKKGGPVTRDNIETIKAQIAADDFTEAVWVTVSGEGLAVVIKIESEKFAETFKALQAYYLNRFGWKIDPSCSDITRPRYIAADAAIFINLLSNTFIVGRDYVGHVKRVTAKMIKDAGKGEVHHTLIKASRLMGGYIAGNLITESEGFEHLVSCMAAKDGVVSIEVEKGKISDGINNGKTEPITAQMLLVNEKNNEADKQAMSELYGFIHACNRRGHKWTDADVVLVCEKFCQQTAISKDQVTDIFKRIYEQNTEEFAIDDKPDIFKVEVFLKKHYDFRRNQITQAIEFKNKGERELTELNVDSIFRKLQHIGFNFPLTKLDSLLKSDFVPEYNPFAEYFQSLNEWDGVTDHIGKLARFISTPDQDFFEIQFKKALVRSIGCALYGVENRIVFVLVQSAQETGKSSFIRFLNPFGGKYYTEAPIHNNKDSSFAFSENFIYNLEELSELNKIEVNRLKAIISTATIKERKAYARNAVSQPRRCNFWASTNKQEFLLDETNTRWLCFDVQTINWAYRQEVAITDVWAQAYALWHNGFNAQLTAEEKARRNDKNRNYEVNDLERELIKRVFIVCEPMEGEFFSNADILQALVNHWEGPASALNSRWIGKNMVQLGFKSDMRKINGHNCRGYWAAKNTDGVRYASEFATTKTNNSPKAENPQVAKTSPLSTGGKKLF